MATVLKEAESCGFASMVQNHPWTPGTFNQPKVIVYIYWRFKLSLIILVIIGILSDLLGKFW